MSNVLKRIILFVIAIPGLTYLILFVPHLNYIWVSLLLSLIGVLCGIELRSMLGNSAHRLGRWTVAIPGLAPLIPWMAAQGWVPGELSVIALTAALIWAFTDAAVAPEGELAGGVQRLGTRLIMVVYPGFFLWWIQAISMVPQARYALLVFMLTVFLNDSGAWLFGLLIGRHRDIVAVSPNKSLEGFVAGILSSVVVIVASSYIFPELLPHPLWQLIVFGLIAGFTTIIGDLSESALKRSVGVKDSGHIILGRGGMLDSIDSLLFTAPIFVLFLGMGA